MSCRTYPAPGHRVARSVAGRQVANADTAGGARFLSAGVVTHWVSGACATLPLLPLLGLPPCPLLVGRVMTLPRRAASLPLVPVQRSFDSSIEWGAPFLESLAPIGILPVSRHRVINDTSES